MFENIDNILNIDPTYIALFGAVVLSTVQLLKNIFPFTGGYSVAVTSIISIIFAVCVSLEWTKVIEILVLGYLIAAAASGTYSWTQTKQKGVEDLFKE
jgi:hypothetical protein